MENKSKYDVIVIGAGPGGSSTAALLAKEGKKVLLVDKDKSAGGRMSVIHSAEGFHYELFPINGVPAYNSRFEYVLQRIGKENSVKCIRAHELGLSDVMYFEDGNGELTSMEMGKQDESFFKALHIQPSDVQGLAKIQKLNEDIGRMPEEEIKKLSMTSSVDFVDSYGEFPGLFRTYFLALCEGAFEMTCDRVPASEMVRLHQLVRKSGGGRYYEYGIGHVFEVFAEAVEEFGGTVLYNSRVKSIDTEKGAVQGITLETGEKYTAPVVVSTAGIRQTVLKLVGEDKFDAGYCERIKGLELNLSCVGYRYFLNAPVVKHPMTVYYPEGMLETYEEFKAKAGGNRKSIKNYVYFGTTSLYPNTAPVGKQLVYACISCYPDPEQDLQPYLDYVESVVRKLQPDLFDHITHREIMTPKQSAVMGTDLQEASWGGESYGIANSVGQSGDQRPSPVSPIHGLYYAGNDAGGFGLGTHQAVDSGVNVADLILSGY